MAVKSGAWKAKAQGGASPIDYVGALKWGTGVNDVHGTRDGGLGRDTAPYEQSGAITQDLTTPYDDDQSYLPEDSASQLWGYGVDTGTADRPSLGQSDDRSEVTAHWPHWGRTKTGIPGGTKVRSLDHGAEATYTGKRKPNGTVSEGWRNKVTSYVNDSDESDPSQLIVRTSDVQRDQTRAGSQMPTGRANEYDAPIHSRIPGMKEKVYSGGARHAEMEPKSQDLIIRPFWARSAGTGYKQWLQPNEMYVSEPMTRAVPDNPYTGPTVTGTDYGYMDEDQSYYV